MSYFTPIHILKNLYYSIIYSYIIYGIEVWGCSNKTQLNRLKNLLNKAVKLLGYSGSADIEDFKNLQIMQFHQIYERFVLCRLFNYLCLGNNQYFYERFTQYNSNHAFNTRFNLSNNFNVPSIHSSKLFYNFHYNAIKLWNGIPSHKRNFQNISEVKKYLREKFFPLNSTIPI